MDQQQSNKRTVVDLCTSPSGSSSAGAERSTSSAAAGERPERKRRRTSPFRPPPSVVDVLTDEDSDSGGSDWPLCIDRPEPPRERERERERRRDVRREEQTRQDQDERLARRLQEEENQRAARSAAAAHAAFGGPFNMLGAGERGQPWEWLGSMARSNMPGDDWRHSLGLPGGLLPHMMPHHLQQQPPPRGVGAGSLLGVGSGILGGLLPPAAGGLFGGGGLAPGARRHGGQLAQLSLMNRDFGEADYEMLLQLDEHEDVEKKKAMRANAKLLDALPTRRVTKAEAKAKEAEGSEGVCVICLESVRAQQQVLTLRCKHEYHKSCILKWLKSCDTPTCPQCKAPVLGADGASSQSAAREESDDEVQEWWPHT